MGVYVQASTAEELKRRADAAGLTYSDLIDLAARYGLSRLTDDALAAWAARQPSNRGRLGGGLTKAEKAVLGALRSLTQASAGTGQVRFELTEVADCAGLLRRDAYLAAKALQQRGLAAGVDGPELDRWDRPKSSVWRLVQPG